MATRLPGARYTSPMFRRCVIALLLAICAAPAQDLAGRADELVQAYVHQKRFQGSVLLAREGKPLFRKSYGLANAEWGIANTPDTKFRLGSITKQFTSALILQLVEHGKIGLQDSIRKYYPEAPEAWQPVTIHDLLCHESGIPSYTEIPGFFAKMAGEPRTPLEIIRLTQDKPLEFAPGTKYKYDNTGYIILGYVIEKVTGKTYEQQLHAAILDPLGMKDTGFDSYTAILPHRAEGYTWHGETLERAPYLDMTLPYAAGSLYSTVDDLSKWDQALYGTAILSEASKQKMWMPNRNDYGYGWMIAQRYGTTALEHGGGINGFNTMIVRLPEKKLLAVVLSNVNTNATGPIATGLLAIALGQPVTMPQQHTPVPVSAGELKPLEGRYANAVLALTIRAEGDHLAARPDGQGEMPFFGLSAKRYFNDAVGAELEFSPDGSTVTVHQGGNDQVLKRQ